LLWLPKQSQLGHSEPARPPTDATTGGVGWSVEHLLADEWAALASGCQRALIDAALAAQHHGPGAQIAFGTFGAAAGAEGRLWGQL